MNLKLNTDWELNLIVNIYKAICTYIIKISCLEHIRGWNADPRTFTHFPVKSWKFTHLGCFCFSFCRRLFCGVKLSLYFCLYSLCFSLFLSRTPFCSSHWRRVVALASSAASRSFFLWRYLAWRSLCFFNFYKRNTSLCWSIVHRP